jgi:hypothetical protein
MTTKQFRSFKGLHPLHCLLRNRNRCGQPAELKDLVRDPVVEVNFHRVLSRGRKGCVDEHIPTPGRGQEKLVPDVGQVDGAGILPEWSPSQVFGRPRQ